MDTTTMNRRVFFEILGAGVTGCFLAPLPLTAQSPGAGSTAQLTRTAKNVIFVLLTGAPSHVDTLDLKVGPWTPASFNPTTINGADWPAGLLPNLAVQFSQGRFSVIRSCQSNALVHSLLQTWQQIARNPSSATGKIAPNVGAVVALEMERNRTPNQKLPGFMAMNSNGALVGGGYFSGRYSPFEVTPAANGLTNLTNSDGQAVFTARYNLLQVADAAIRTSSPFGRQFGEMADYYTSARGMMYDNAVTNAFRFTAEEQQRYGSTAFGNACLTARNVIASNLGTRYVQINLGGWDNHQNIYAANGLAVPARSFDFGLSNLLSDLAIMPGTSGGSLLDETLIVAKGEFGRTVGNLTGAQGRDHYFVHSALLAGGGVRGGRAIGGTGATGAFVEDPGWSQQRPVYAEDIMATIYSAMGIDYTTQRNDDPLGRGFEYIPSSNAAYVGVPVLELFQ